MKSTRKYRRNCQRCGHIYWSPDVFAGGSFCFVPTKGIGWCLHCREAHPNEAEELATCA